MSELLNLNKDFLSLLLDTSKVQQKKLIQSITKNQVDSLGEIFFNLNSMKFAGRTAKFLNSKKRNFMKKVANKKLSYEFKKKKYNKDFILMIKILSHFKSQLKSLIL